MKRLTTTVVLAAVLALLASPAFAHPGHFGGTDVIAGLLHPVSGIDHLLAMVLAGVMTARMGDRALWIVPSAFLSFMAIGAALGIAGLAVPGLEGALVLSAVALGMFAAASARLPMMGAAALAAIVAVVHGAAHGAELPAGTAALPFLLGLLVSTAILLMTGIAAGQALRAQKPAKAWVPDRRSAKCEASHRRG